MNPQSPPHCRNRKWPTVLTATSSLNLHTPRLPLCPAPCVCPLPAGADLADGWLGVLVVPVAVHLLPDVAPLGGVVRGDGGAVVGVTEPLALQNVLRVLLLMLARQHGRVGHAVGTGT